MLYSVIIQMNAVQLYLQYSNARTDWKIR